jgi:hypothetical protein
MDVLPSEKWVDKLIAQVKSASPQLNGKKGLIGQADLTILNGAKLTG